MFMTIEELREMSRAWQASKICKFLTKHGIPYRLDLEDKPVVLRAAAEKAFTPDQRAAPRVWRPDFSLLRDDDGKTKKERSRRSAS